MAVRDDTESESWDDKREAAVSVSVTTTLMDGGIEEEDEGGGGGEQIRSAEEMPALARGEAFRSAGMVMLRCAFAALARASRTAARMAFGLGGMLGVSADVSLIGWDEEGS